MTRYRRYITLIMAAALMGSCDLVTPDEIVNPNVDEKAFLRSDNPMETWVNGTEKELALHLSDFVEMMEILSDNYFNNFTRSSKVFDIPQLLYTDADVTNLQRHVGALREMADYGLTKVAEADPHATNAQRFKLLYIKAYSFILAGDFFRALPTENGGEAVEWNGQMQRAMEVLDEALPLAQDDNDRALIHTLYARAAHRIGFRDVAVTHARQALSLLERNALSVFLYDSDYSLSCCVKYLSLTAMRALLRAFRTAASFICSNAASSFISIPCMWRRRRMVCCNSGKESTTAIMRSTCW